MKVSETLPRDFNSKDFKNSESKQNFITTPDILLPKGGGAIRGIEEKFSVNPVTGANSISIPIYCSPGRSGFGPELSLSYNSGAGNGFFGFGWELSLPAITRKTEKGLPRYKDTEESDVFILSGCEDLVPCLGNECGLLPQESEDKSFNIYYYRPRIEGLFARIEKWACKQTGYTYWRAIDKNNITTYYGKTENARIVDMEDHSRIFQWLIEESRDDKGNIILYTYKHENTQQIDRSLVSEKNRLLGNAGLANKYLKSIEYGNRTPGSTDFLFMLVLDYGEHDYNVVSEDVDGKQKGFVTCTAAESKAWDVRPDPFSTYRAGFEIRNYRLCQRILMFHLFSELEVNPYLVKSTDFNYNDSGYSFIASVVQKGYVWDEQTQSYVFQALPPLEFTYSKASIQSEIRTIDHESRENLPVGIAGGMYQWMDLENEGIAGILTEQAGAWYYKHNLGDGSLAPAQLVEVKPSASINDGKFQFVDLAGEGRNCLVRYSQPMAGYYEQTEDNCWEAYSPFQSVPNIDWDDPNLRFIDLNGDGLADLLISEDNVFIYYLSRAKEGFNSAEFVNRLNNEEKGPALLFADATQSVYLADMSGDGLTDIVRIRNGEVCYWPNLGYGRFGWKVTMDNSPYFDYADLFSQSRFRLADIDGTGTADIIYLGRNTITCWFNQSGNGWSKNPAEIKGFPVVDQLSDVRVIDFTGRGTACLVWSSLLPGDSQGLLKFIDLMGEKPHLLKSIDNNLGKVTTFTYTQSTRFYLEDKKSGNPWITKLPFPVHVVERVVSYDQLSRNHFVTRYAYHHGYYDGVEREFRGFGMVEQWDTEEIGTLQAGNSWSPAANIDEASYVPPVHTKTWFHTGANFNGKIISRQYETEYYQEPNFTPGQQQLMLLYLMCIITGSWWIQLLGQPGKRWIWILRETICCLSSGTDVYICSGLPLKNLPDRKILR